MSSRENPNVIWVKSFVPKEKNCATSAILSAVNAARGISIIVPVMCGISLKPNFSQTCLYTA
ncbi:hypothetical protein U14_01264 [Candidatus Moduliflexus flocculans]|uniref:Uncharacterized protein n=1 Tax=Candidatus Moduliflexus flocculans TaxID=1499966 RepID=A0A0S6VS03_9BACT|nr:hypothetical protein U14_01264 [Candidatus Moduliflexus flocculans]